MITHNQTTSESFHCRDDLHTILESKLPPQSTSPGSENTEQIIEFQSKQNQNSMYVMLKISYIIPISSLPGIARTCGKCTASPVPGIDVQVQSAVILRMCASAYMTIARTQPLQ